MSSKIGTNHKNPFLGKGLLAIFLLSLLACDPDFSSPAARDPKPGGGQEPSSFGDPRYKDQWYLKNTGQFEGRPGLDINVEPVWQQGWLGQGLFVGVVEINLLDKAHPDLQSNIVALKDMVGGSVVKSHATNVAGLIAAKDNNIGIRGVAPRAKIYSYAIGPGSKWDGMVRVYTDEHRKIAVYNASVGPGLLPAYQPLKPSFVPAFDTATKDGFYGKGSSLVFAAGNSGYFVSQYVPSHNNFLLLYHAVIAVNSIVKTGRVLSNEFGGTYGNNLWLLAPTGKTSTKDPFVTTGENEKGGDGKNDGYYEYFASTSGAAPLVSGVIVLMRQARPELTWRDVKLILAESANKSWQDSKYPYVTSGRMYSDSGREQKYSQGAGFGLVNAAAAVDLAKNWTLLPPMQKTELNTSTNITVLNTFSESAIDVSSSPISYVESVEIVLNYTESGGGDTGLWAKAHLELSAPDAKKSVFEHIRLQKGGDTIQLISNNFLGSDSVQGSWKWKLKLSTKSKPDVQLKITGWKIIIRGH